MICSYIQDCNPTNHLHTNISCNSGMVLNRTTTINDSINMDVDSNNVDVNNVVNNIVNNVDVNGKE